MCNNGSMTNKYKNKRRVTIFINPAIATQARAQAVVEGITRSVLIEKALISYLPKETIIKKIDTTELIDRK